MLIDSATIIVRSGRGGDGNVSFRREKYIPKGGPDGGDGGDGGSVILEASHNVDTLMDFSGRHHWYAENGESGGRKQQIGKDGEDLVIALPPGTLIYDADTDELIADLDHLGKRIVIAEGGKGGLGNERFKSATNQTPREATPGEPAVQRHLRLELKIIADIGLIGLPNAGKSTLLSRISKATPKIADYPFTTLEPNLGIAELSNGRRIVFADIPGLIEHAHEGQGLGTRFLRHVERTRLLVHLIDIDPADASDPAENYRIIRNELAAYSQTLADKPELVVLSKMDLAGGDEDRDAAVELFGKALNRPVLTISSASGVGLTELLEACWEKLPQKDEEEISGWRSSMDRIE
jgi:GTP-binding protein